MTDLDIKKIQDWSLVLLDKSKAKQITNLVKMFAYSSCVSNDTILEVIKKNKDQFVSMRSEELTFCLGNMLVADGINDDYNEFYKAICGKDYTRDNNEESIINDRLNTCGVSKLENDNINFLLNIADNFNDKIDVESDVKEEILPENNGASEDFDEDDDWDKPIGDDGSDGWDKPSDEVDNDDENKPIKDENKPIKDENEPIKDENEPIKETVKADKKVEDANETNTVKKALGYVDTKIDNTIVEIKKIYTAMFGSGYGVIQPEGVLCGVDGGSMLHFEEGDYEHPKLRTKQYLSEVWNSLQQELGLKESRSRGIIYEDINSGYNYYPYKLLEFTFGRYLSSEEDIANNRYKKSSASNSWETYWDKDVKPKLKKYIQDVIEAHLKVMYRDGTLNLSNPSELYKSVNNTLERTLSAYVPAIVVSEDSAGRFKIRFSDYKHKVSSDTLKQLELKFIKFIGTVEDDLTKASSSVTRLNDTIKEIEIRRDSNLCGTVPLFAYKALRKLREQGKNPSWESIILGRAEDDSIYIGNSEETFTKGFNTFRSDSTPVIHVSAGSRSGKGVMTLNLLASAYASELPVFYLDCKPDMASMLLNLANKNGVKTFVMNGGGYDKTFDTNDVVAHIPEHYHIPEGLESVDKNMQHWGALKYLKALDFLMWLMPKIDKGNVPTKHENMVVVADELQKLAGSWALLYNNLSDKKNTKLKKGEEDAGVAAAGKLIKWYGELVNDWKSAEKFSLKGIKPTMFLIYQEHQNPSYKSELKNREDTGNVSNTYFFNTLHDLSTRGFIGYDLNSYHADKEALNQSGSRIQPVLLTTKGRKYCNVNDRYFAWVNNVTSQDTNVKNDTTSAIFIKPFLILNDADENGIFVDTLKKQLKNAVKTDDKVEKILNSFRTEDGKLDESIGFEGYMNEMASNIPGYSIGNALKSSYDVFMYVLDKFGYMKASGAQDPMDYFTDFRPEFMPSWSRMDEALNNGKKFSSGEVEDTSSTPEDGGSIESSFDGTVFDADGNAENSSSSDSDSNSQANNSGSDSFGDSLGSEIPTQTPIPESSGGNTQQPLTQREQLRQIFNKRHAQNNNSKPIDAGQVLNKPRTQRDVDLAAAERIIKGLEVHHGVKMNQSQKQQFLPFVLNYLEIRRRNKNG